MDILDFFWTFYLNHLSPLQGYFLNFQNNDEFKRWREFGRQGDDGGPAGTAELEEEWWVTSGVGILKLSVLLYYNTAIFHVQVEVHVEISF